MLVTVKLRSKKKNEINNFLSMFYETNMEISEDLFNLITNFQNEVHNTAIGYHKMLRDKSMVKSELDNISGIGNVKKIELLKKFGSVENIAKASVDEIASVKGINKELAEKISKELTKKF